MRRRLHRCGELLRALCSGPASEWQRHARKVDSLRRAVYVARMQVSFALFADAANLSQEGKLNILGVFDAVQVVTLPAVHPRAHLVFRLKGDREEFGSHTVALSWSNPNGTELWSSNGELNIGKPPSDVQELDLPLIAAVDLPLDVAGTYTVGIALDGQPHAQLVLQVRSGAVGMPAPGRMVS